MSLRHDLARCFGYTEQALSHNLVRVESIVVEPAEMTPVEGRHEKITPAHERVTIVLGCDGLELSEIWAAVAERLKSQP
jgi:hypothetical protein